MARVTPGVLLYEGDLGLNRLNREVTGGERYTLVEAHEERSTVQAGYSTMRRVWRDTWTGNTLEDRVAIRDDEPRDNYYRMPPHGTREHEVRETATEFQNRTHADESERLRRIEAAISSLSSAERYNGLPREASIMLEVLVLMHREMQSYHNHLIWLTRREPPRQNDRVEELEARISELEATIDLLNNQP